MKVWIVRAKGKAFNYTTFEDEEKAKEFVAKMSEINIECEIVEGQLTINGEEG